VSGVLRLGRGPPLKVGEDGRQTQPVLLDQRLRDQDCVSSVALPGSQPPVMSAVLPGDVVTAAPAHLAALSTGKRAENFGAELERGSQRVADRCTNDCAGCASRPLDQVTQSEKVAVASWLSTGRHKLSGGR